MAESNTVSGPALTDSSPLGSECQVKGLTKPRSASLAAAAKIKAKARAQKKVSRAEEKAVNQSQKALDRAIAKASKQPSGAQYKKI